jgi:drug/metabolite transporter (DMT)-like permease
MGTEPTFTRRDWALLGFVAVAWGSSFLFIDIGVDHFAPGVVALLRLVFGAATLAAVPAARSGVPRSAWPGIALLGVVWMAVPFVLFGVAEQSIDSSLAGMLNASAPLFTAIVAGLIARRLPSRRRAAGLLIGFVGVLAISWPSLQGAHATAAGAGLVVAATMLYGVAFNVTGPLQRRHGALPVIWRAQLVAIVLVAPLGVATIPASTFAWSSLAAVAALGCLGTALAFVAFATLVGRVGSTRGSVTVYFLPAVAIALGALFRDETIAAVSLLGTALVTAGAYVTTRVGPHVASATDTGQRRGGDRLDAPGGEVRHEQLGAAGRDREGAREAARAQRGDGPIAARERSGHVEHGQAAARRATGEPVRAGHHERPPAGRERHVDRCRPDRERGEQRVARTVHQPPAVERQDGMALPRADPDDVARRVMDDADGMAPGGRAPADGSRCAVERPLRVNDRQDAGAAPLRVELARDEDVALVAGEGEPHRGGRQAHPADARRAPGRAHRDELGT